MPPVELQVMSWLSPTVQLSPPLGAVTVMPGSVRAKTVPALEFPPLEVVPKRVSPEMIRDPYGYLPLVGLKMNLCTRA